MKKIKKVIFSLMAASVLSVSCDDVLNISPTTSYSAETIWGDLDAVDHYVYGLYSYFLGYCEMASTNCSSYTDCFSDIMKSGSYDQYSHPYNMAILLPNSFTSTDAGAFECWSSCYTIIAKVNEFLKYAPEHMDLGVEEMNTRIAEVKVIRAYMYYHLTKIYGGVVLRKELDGPDQNNKARSSESECWDYVIEELEDAAAALPQKWSDARGRFTKAGAFGLMSRCALYAKNWDKVIDAADSCKYYGAYLASNYTDVFSNVTSAENLITVEFVSSKIYHGADSYFRPIGDQPYHNNHDVYGVITPTCELVDSYEMADGSEFSWDEYGEDPYVNREPRFYASVIYDGCTWEGRDVETCVSKNCHESLYNNYGEPGQQLVSTRDTVRNGTDAMDDFEMSGTTVGTPTGYYFKKFITENDSEWEAGGSTHFATMVRYAEVLLNKAEAYAMKNNIPDALTCLNEVRNRVDLPGREASTQVEFMKYLRHERKVELAGEGFRYWDIRRWRLGEELLNGVQCHGVKITRNEENDYDAVTGVELASTITSRSFQQVSCDTENGVRYFYEKYYAFSIPLDERSNNTEVTNDNNPGW